MVQWGILCASKARDMGLMPGWGTRIPHAVQLRLHMSHSQKKKKIERRAFFWLHFIIVPYILLIRTGSPNWEGEYF